MVVGSIPKEFGDLPDEVLETVLAHHQKAVTLPRGPDGSPRFAAISGGDEGAAVNAARGQERVVIARLKDARFFYNEDRKRTIESRVDDLAAVTFHKGLGTYKQKAERISLLATDLAGHLGLIRRSDHGGRAGRALRQGRPRHPDGPGVPRASRASWAACTRRLPRAPRSHPRFAGTITR